MNRKKKKLIDSIKLEEVMTRENLVSFYNELNETMIKSVVHLKRKPSKARIKKVCEPILDKWVKIFEGALIRYTCEIKLDKKNVWQKKIELKDE